MSSSEVIFKAKIRIVWGNCGKDKVALPENPTQAQVDDFVKKHSRCQEGPFNPRLVGYIKDSRVALTFVAEPPQCKFSGCVNYKKDANKFCAVACETDHRDQKKAKKREAEKNKIQCKSKKCKNYDSHASGYCSRSCKSKGKKERH